MEESPTSFSKKYKTKEVSLDPQSLVKVSIIEFLDKIIIQLTLNGEMDSTYDIQLPSSNQINHTIVGESSGDMGVGTVCLVGDPSNMKSCIMCSQVGKLFLSVGANKNIIITTSTKFWKRDEDEGDFDKLMFILNLIRETYNT